MRIYPEILQKLSKELAAEFPEIGFNVSDIKATFCPDTQIMGFTIEGKSYSPIPIEIIRHCVEKIFDGQSLEITATERRITIEAK